MAAPAPRADAGVAAVQTTAAFALRINDWEHALLACDFASSDRPGLVTSLLAALFTRPDGALIEPIELWNLPVSTRLLALLRIVAALESTDSLMLQLHCPRPECREWLEIPLTLSELAAFHQQHASQDTLVLPCGERTISLRRPTGDDLRRWRASVPVGDETSAHQAMLRDLVLAGDASSPELVEGLGEALTSFDPLVDFTLTTACPACGRSADYPLDLEAIALERLRARQERLLKEIHRVARAYGWTESEVLAVPASRRARYLELIEATP